MDNLEALRARNIELKTQLANMLPQIKERGIDITEAQKFLAPHQAQGAVDELKATEDYTKFKASPEDKQKLEAKTYAEALLNKGLSDEEVTKMTFDKYPELENKRGALQKTMEVSGGFMTDFGSRVGKGIEWLGGGKMENPEQELLNIDKALEAGEIDEKEASVIKGIIERNMKGNVLQKAGRGLQDVSKIAGKEMEAGMGLDLKSGYARAGEIGSAITTSAIAGAAATPALATGAPLALRAGAGLIEGLAGSAAESIGRTGEVKPGEVVAGGVLGAVLPGVGAALKPVAKAARETVLDPLVSRGAKFVSALSSKANVADDVATKIAIRKAQGTADDFLMKALKPSLRKGGSAKYIQKGREGIDAVVQNKKSLQFLDDAGNTIKGKVPKNLSEMGQALDQTNDGFAHTVDNMLKSAEGTGVVVKTENIIDDLVNKFVKKGAPKAERKFIEGMVKQLDEFKGSMTPGEANEFIKNLNSSLEGYYNKFGMSMSDKTKGNIMATTAKMLRKNLDETISGITDKSFQDIKTQWGAVISLRKDVNRKLWAEAKKSNKNLIDFTDVFTGGSIASGLITQNPALLTKGLAGKAIKSYTKHMNNPNRMVKAIFSATDELHNTIGATTKSAVQEAIEGGGVTIRMSGTMPKKGYSYSPYKNLETIIEPSSLNNDTVRKFMIKNNNMLKKPGHFLGAWKEKGKYYLDISVVDNKLDDAIRSASKSDQLAIYDLVAGESIDVTENLVKASRRGATTGIKRTPSLSNVAIPMAVHGNKK